MYNIELSCLKKPFEKNLNYFLNRFEINTLESLLNTLENLNSDELKFLINIKKISIYTLN